MRVIIAGPKSVGKSTVGSHVAQLLGLPFFETDDAIVALHKQRGGEELTCRAIAARLGSQAFRALERKAVAGVCAHDWCVIATGGSTLLHSQSRRLLRNRAIIVALCAPPETIWARVAAQGIPAFLNAKGAQEKFCARVARTADFISSFADIEIDAATDPPDTTADKTVALIAQHLAVQCTVPNTYGEIVRVMTFGESHGVAIGCIIEGVQPGIAVSVDDIQKELDRRRPGQSSVSSPRKERDQVRILSGVFEGTTTGAPICLILMSEDQQPSAYEGLRDVFRPGHADFTFWKKYGIRDHRGGGRSSGRETAGRVAAGAVARKILADRGVVLKAYALEIGGIRAETCDYDLIETNPVRCPDPAAAEQMIAAILAAKEANDSLGGVIELRINGVPAGLGDPVFGKLDARLAHALLSIGATKGFEIGDGFAVARTRGSSNNDGMSADGFLSNHAGGITGGISNGNEIVIRVAVKPTSSITQPQRTVSISGAEREVIVEGRHDPCLVPRIVPVIESMAALVLLDAWELQTRLRPEWSAE
jgi:chorismate synthase